MKNAMFEALEMRALMSLVVDLRVAGGAGDAKQVAVTHAGQRIQLEAWGVVTGANDVTDEAMQSAMGSFLSSAGGAALGDLSVTRVAPFNYFGSQDGKIHDLDGDGDLDIGGTGTNAGEFYNARSQFMQFTGEPLPDGLPGWQFKLADVTFTATQLLSTTATTELNFQPRPNAIPGFHAIWREDNTPKNPRTGTFAGGTPVALTVVPATISGSVFIDENGNGIRQEDDKAAAGWLVFDDLDGDGIHDLNEVSALTDANGNFTLSVVPGTHTIRIVQQARYEPSRSLPTSYTFTVAALDEAGGALFGQKPI